MKIRSKNSQLENKKKMREKSDTSPRVQNNRFKISDLYVSIYKKEFYI